MGGKNDHDI